MMSETLYREGFDLDELLADLDLEHPGQVHVVEVTYDRKGGVLGFFARKRVGVHYRVGPAAVPTPDDAPFPPDPARSDLGSTTDGALESLLSAADAAEMVESGQLPDPPVRSVVPAPASVQEAPNVQFARMLLDLAAQKAAQRLSNGEPAVIPFVTTPVALAPIPASVAVAPVTIADPPSTVGPVAAPVAVLSAPRTAVTPPVSAAAFAAPAVAEAIAAPAIAAPAIATPAIATPAIATPAIAAPAIVPEVAVFPAQPQGAPTVEIAPAAHHRARPAQPTHSADPYRQNERRTGAHRAVRQSTRTQFSVRRQLSEIGVPVAWIPDDCADAYWAIETLVARLPLASTPDLGPGDILVVAGPAVEAMNTARQLCTRLRLDPAAIRTAGCPDGQSALLSHRWQAAALAAEIRSQHTTPAIVVVATDDSRGSDDPDDDWASGMVAALAPTKLWLVVDAGHKPADCRALVGSIGRVDALALTGAARTTSPASVWELEVPIAVIDGRPASRGVWAALLIDKLAALDT